MNDQQRVDDLPPRLRQVLALLAAGMANKQISARLGISVGTVEQYRNLIFARLDVNGVAQAAVMAERAGLLEEKPGHDLAT